MANNIIISSKELRNMNPSGVAEIESSAAFCHYTSVKSLTEIIKGETFQFSPISSANDIDEAELHKKDGENIYTFCLCNSDTEKIPMWYLYGGIAGKGAKIKITPANIRNLVSSIDAVTTDTKKMLEKGKDFDLEFGWVFYQKNDLKTVKYRHKYYELDDLECFAEDNYFIKNYSWEYEKEFRIIIKVKNGEQYKHLYAAIPSQVLTSLKIQFAPEITKEEVRHIVETNKVLLDYLLSKFEYSKLDIKMGLLNRNCDSIIELLREVCTDYDRLAMVCKRVEEYCRPKSKDGSHHLQQYNSFN